jgi:hypothetical protein
LSVRAQRSVLQRLGSGTLRAYAPCASATDCRDTWHAMSGRQPPLLLIPFTSELEWEIRPQLEEWADVLAFDPPGVEFGDALRRFTVGLED